MMITNGCEYKKCVCSVNITAQKWPIYSSLARVKAHERLFATRLLTKFFIRPDRLFPDHLFHDIVRVHTRLSVGNTILASSRT